MPKRLYENGPPLRLAMRLEPDEVQQTASGIDPGKTSGRAGQGEHSGRGGHIEEPKPPRKPYSGGG